MLTLRDVTHVYPNGTLAMFLLQERLGEARVNRALRTLLERFRFKGAPYPRSLDLVADATAVRRADGEWEVTVSVTAKQYTVDAAGTDRESEFAEPIEVALYAAGPDGDPLDARHRLVAERRPVRSGAQRLTFVTDRKPTHAAVDPSGLYIDRNIGDNVARVAAPE